MWQEFANPVYNLSNYLFVYVSLFCYHWVTAAVNWEIHNFERQPLSLQQNTVTYKSISLLYIFDLHKFHTTLQSP